MTPASIPTTTGRNRSPDGGGFPSALPAISLPAPAEIALRSRGTPRLANNRLRWVRDYALSRADGRVSLAVAHTLNLAPDTLVDEVEPFLLRKELVVRTPRGRRLTPAAFEHLRILPPADSDPSGQRKMF